MKRKFFSNKIFDDKLGTFLFFMFVCLFTPFLFFGMCNMLWILLFTLPISIVVLYFTSPKISTTKENNKMKNNSTIDNVLNSKREVEEMEKQLKIKKSETEKLRKFAKDDLEWILNSGDDTNV